MYIKLIKDPYPPNRISNQIQVWFSLPNPLFPTQLYRCFSIQGFAQSLQQLGSVISKYGCQCSKGLPTTNSLVQPLHIEMADKGAFTVYTATHKVFSWLQGFCKILYTVKSRRLQCALGTVGGHLGMMQP